MEDKGTISLQTIWTEAELIAVRTCVIEEQPLSVAAETLHVSESTIARLITSAYEAARDVAECGYEINFDNSDFRDENGPRSLRTL